MNLEQYQAEQKELNEAWATVLRLNRSRSQHEPLKRAWHFQARQLDERWHESNRRN